MIRFGLASNAALRGSLSVQFSRTFAGGTSRKDVLESLLQGGKDFKGKAKGADDKRKASADTLASLKKKIGGNSPQTVGGKQAKQETLQDLLQKFNSNTNVGKANRRKGTPKTRNTKSQSNATPKKSRRITRNQQINQQKTAEI